MGQSISSGDGVPADKAAEQENEEADLGSGRPRPGAKDKTASKEPAKEPPTEPADKPRSGRPRAGRGKKANPEAGAATGTEGAGTDVAKPPPVETATGELPTIEGIEFFVAGDVDRTKVPVRILVFGKSGAGKTHLLTATATRKVLVVLVETQGFNTIARANPRAIVPGKRDANNVPRVGTLDELRAILKAVRDGAFAKYGLDLLVFDGATEIQLMMIDDILARQRKPSTVATDKDAKNDSATRMKRAERVLTQQDWGTVADRFRAFMRTVRDLPVDVAMTALADWKEDEETKQVQLSPMLKGSSAKSVNGYFNAVFYLYRKQSADAEDGALGRFLLTDGDERYSVKPDGGLRGVIEPAIDPILDVLHGARDPDSVLIAGAPLPHARPGAVVRGGLEIETEDEDEDPEGND